MTSPEPDPRYPLPLLVTGAAAIFQRAGLPEEAARTVAEALVEADARGTPSHGLMLVPMYVDRLRAGSVSTAVRAEILTDFDAVAVLDGGHALGVLTGDQAMAMAIQKAHSYGIGLVSTRHAFHFGGAYRYAEAAAAAGCIGIAASNTRPLMPAPGGATAVVGNNPLAIAVPGAEPLVLDMALSEAALGKIRLAESEGTEIPPTWATDRDGSPTTDPTAALAGLLLPTGGPKGYGLALLIDALTGILSGGAFGSQVKGLYADVAAPNDCAHLMIAIEVAALGPLAAFTGGVATLAEEVRASRLAPGTTEVLLPGERERRQAQRSRADGVPVAESVLAALREVADGLGASLPEELR